MADPTAKPVRVGLIGAGRIAQVAHLPALAKSRQVELSAVCDPSEALATGVARHHGVEAFTSVDELLDSPIDAVLIATPDRTHYTLATQALSAGKHVLVEKPLVDNVEDAERLVKVVADSGKKLQVGAMKRHDPGVQFAKEALTSIGPVVSAQVWYRVMSSLRSPIESTLFPVTMVDHSVRKKEAAYKADRQRYLLATHGAHVFDGLRYMAGEVESVRATSAQVGSDYTWHGTATLAASGGLVSFEISANVHAEWSEGFAIYGQRGHISVRSFFPFFRRASEASVFTEGDCVTRSPAFGDTDPYKRQLDAFASAIVHDLPTDPDARDGVAAVRFIRAVESSSCADGQRMTP